MRNIIGNLLLTVFFLSGCVKNNTPSTETIQIGGLLSITGNWSTLGVTSREAINLAIEDVNSYYEQTGSRFRFAAVHFDTKLDTALAKTAMQNAQQKGIRFFIGPQSSAELSALQTLTNSSQSLIISQGSTASSLAIANDGIFRFCPGDAVEGAAMANTIYTTGKRVLISLARDDAGNKGLQSQTGTYFTSLGGTTEALTPYSTTSTDYTVLLAQLKNKIQQYTLSQGATKIAVYLASFDECVALFKQAAADPVFSSVNWYGGDGAVFSTALTADAAASAFASSTLFFAPNFGLPQLAHPRLATLLSTIKTRTGIDADAYALAAYDAVWVIAHTVSSSPAGCSYELRKQLLLAEATQFNGITGPVFLNAAGDRSSGSFDYWGIQSVNGTYKWKWVGRSL